VLPLSMLVVYTFVFSTVLQARWEGSADGGAGFALRLFAGMLLFGIFAECLNEAPGLLLQSQSFLKQVLFPSEILAWVSLLSALWRFAMGFALLLVAQLLAIGAPPPSALVLPLVLVPVALLALGSSWLVSSLGVFLRDLAQIVTVFTSAVMFLSPVFYPASRVPEPLRPWFSLNPLTAILEAARPALFDGTLPDWNALAIVTAASFAFAWLGYAWFVRTKPGFVDVL
jgi:lipopolysaccharide transport system permease protein